MLPVLPPHTLVIGIRTKWVKLGQVIIFEHDNKEKIKRVDQIEHDTLFVLGDHAEASTDSRHFGWIQRDTIIARVIWPKTKQPS